MSECASFDSDTQGDISFDQQIDGFLLVLLAICEKLRFVYRL
ncbi:hypothetical protein ACKUSY_12400 [Myroides odoratus]